MSALITNYLKSFTSALGKQGTSITTLVVILATALLNYVSDKSFFRCPEKGYRSYGLAFIVCPAFITGMLILLISNSLYEAVSGYCRRDVDAKTREGWLKNRPRRWKFVLRKLSYSLVQSYIAFISWIILTLLFTDAYSCIQLGPAPKNKLSLAVYTSKKANSNSDSQIMGFCLLIFTIIVALISNFIVKCCYTAIPKKDLPSMRRYDQWEAEAANEAFIAHMKEVAKYNGISQVHEMLGIDHCPLKCMEGIVVLGSCQERYDKLKKLRGFMAEKYPRLDNSENLDLEYRKDIVGTEKFLAPETVQCRISLKTVAEDSLSGEHESSRLIATDRICNESDHCGDILRKAEEK